MEPLMLNLFKQKRKTEEGIKSLGNGNIKVLFLCVKLLFNSTSNMDFFISDVTWRLSGLFAGVLHTPQ